MHRTLKDAGEFGLIRHIQEVVEREGAGSQYITAGIGDDCACFRPGEGFEVLVTCDCMVEGRHYIPGCITPFEIGRRAMVMNISDIGAMGGIPRYAVISLGIKKDTPVKDVEEMYRGFLYELNPIGASIIGGNITGSESLTFINITLTGEVEKEKIVRRSGANAGDVILVTGYPGQAAIGLKRLQENLSGNDLSRDQLVSAYNLPVHRAREGRAVALSCLATSMIDISDGLMGDLGHICEESGVGAEVIRNRLPISAPVRELIDPQGWDIFEMIIGDSDDYELIVTCAPCNRDELISVIRKTGNVPVTEIGIITPRKGIKLILPNGVSHPVRVSGWDHFR